MPEKRRPLRWIGIVALCLLLLYAAGPHVMKIVLAFRHGTPKTVSGRCYISDLNGRFANPKYYGHIVEIRGVPKIIDSTSAGVYMALFASDECVHGERIS